MNIEAPVFGEDETLFVSSACAVTFLVFILTHPSLQRSSFPLFNWYFSLSRFLPLTLLNGHESADGDASDVFGSARALGAAGVSAVARTL